MELHSLMNVIYSILSSVFSCVTLHEGSDINLHLTHEPGHLKPFGTGRPVHQIEEISDFPDPKTFFNEFFHHQKPVKIKNGAHYTPSFHLWTDEYFLNLDIPGDAKPISSETLKKEDRSQAVKEMDFKELVKIYKNTSYYMVDAIPEYLKKDVVLPFSIQCPDLLNGALEESIMWLSGGGTSSVVHADPSENFNCVYRGTKDFILVDPIKYEDFVTFDGTPPGYSLMDVDKVDYLKYPGMSKVEFVSAHLDEGDCLYIPSGWIHQVRSFNVNLAVNIWWHTDMSRFVDVDGCNTEFDSNLTLDKVQISGIDDRLYVRDVVIHVLSSQPDQSMSKDDFILAMYESYLEGLEIDKVKIGIFMKKYRELFKNLDEDGDGILTLKEFLAISLDKLRKCNKTIVLSMGLESRHKRKSAVTSDTRESDHTEL